MSLERDIGEILRSRKLTVSAAESCTGGRIGDKITDIPGSSDYFLGSAVTYSNEAKRDILGVSEDSLRSFGAVSEQVANEMAKGCRNAFGSDLGLSTTGIAGPSGGSAEKPVGLVWFGISDGNMVETESALFPGDRLEVKEVASVYALEMLLRFLRIR